MEDDSKTNAELKQIRDEIMGAQGEQRRRLFEAYVNTAHDGMQASIEDIPELIKAFIRQSQDRYPSMMDVCDGNVDEAAGKVLGMMLMHDRGGDTISVGEACDICEEVAAMLVSDLHKHGRYQGRFRL